MGYTTSLGAEETVGTPVSTEVMLTRLDDRTKQILEHQRKAEVRWKWQTIAGVAGAVFAAVRLGIIAVPTIKEHRDRWRTRPATPNPARRRRRRTRRS